MSIDKTLGNLGKGIGKYWLGSIVVVALALVFTGAWIAYRAYSDFAISQQQSVHFDKNNTIADLGTVLSGAAGSLFTLAGIVLLLVTIYQTKAEMVATQKIMFHQLTESTFFNLLKNHKEVILHDAESVRETQLRFSSQIWILRTKVEKYNECLRLREFSSFNDALSPAVIYKSIDCLTAIGNSLVHIHNFIENKLVDKDSFFYQHTFYYNLNVDEKFLLGFIAWAALDRITPSEFLYTIDFSLKNQNPLKGFFPKIGLQLKEARLNSLEYDDCKDIIDNDLNGHLRLYFEPTIELKKLRYSIGPFSEHDTRREVKGMIEITSSFQDYNILKLIAKPIFDMFQKENKVDVMLTFFVLYNGQEYKIWQRLEFSSSTWIVIPLPTEDNVNRRKLSDIEGGKTLQIRLLS